MNSLTAKHNFDLRSHPNYNFDIKLICLVCFIEVYTKSKRALARGHDLTFRDVT